MFGNNKNNLSFSCQILTVFIHSSCKYLVFFLLINGVYMYSPKNRVIVKEIEQENVTLGGVVLVPTMSDVDNLAKLGEVIVDAFVSVDCNTVKIPKGQKVYYGKFSGVRFNKDGEKYTSLAFSEIVAFDD